MGTPEHHPLGEPPADPESWTDAQWIAWLEASDDPEEHDTASPATHAAWTRRPPASMLGAAMVGLHELIYGRAEEAAIVVDAGGDPPHDDRPEVHLDRDHPERSEVVVRRRPPAPTERPRPAR
jgi:hypothetical protein